MAVLTRTQPVRASVATSALPAIRDGVCRSAGAFKLPVVCERSGGTVGDSQVSVSREGGANCRPDIPLVDEPPAAVIGGASIGVPTWKVEQARSSRAIASSSAQDIKMLLHSRELLKVKRQVTVISCHFNPESTRHFLAACPSIYSSRG